jgi:hypothetical protein
VSTYNKHPVFRVRARHAEPDYIALPGPTGDGRVLKIITATGEEKNTHTPPPPEIILNWPRGPGINEG